MPTNDMNMDVTVRLRDETRRGGEAIERMLKRISEATGKPGTERGVRGLAKALSSLDRASTDAGVNRLSRVAGAVRGLGHDAGRIDSAAKAVGALSRSLGRLSRTAEDAERAAGAMTSLRDALTHMPASGGFVGETNRELRDTIELQRRVRAGMRDMGGPGSGGSGGGGGGVRGPRRGRNGGHGGSFDSMMGHAFFGATSGIVMGGEAIRELYSQGAERVDEFTKMQMAGVDAAQVARNRNAAVATARIVGGSGINQNLATLRHLRFALGSDAEATRSLTPVAQATATMRMMNPGIDAEGNAFSMAKAAEMKGVSQDPEKFRRIMGMMANTAIATGGKTTGEDFRAFTAMSKGAATFLSPDAYAGLVSSIGGELGAGETGNALAMSTRATIGNVMTKKGREQFERLGLWDAGGKSIKDAGSFQADPHKWIEDHLIPVLKANGMLKMDADGNVDPEKSKEVGKLFAKMFSNSNVASFFTLLTTQSKRYEKDQALRNKVAVDNFAMQQKSPSYAMGAMTQSFKDMLGTMSEADMPELIAGLNGLTKAFNGIAAMDPHSLGLVTELGTAFLALGPAIWTARLGYLTFVKPLRELPALLRVSTAAIQGVAASEYAAAAATGAWNASALILSTTLGRLGAVVGAGYAAKVIQEQAGQFVAAGTDSLESDATKSDRATRYRSDLARQNATIADPQTGFFSRQMARLHALSDERFLDAHGVPRVAGARARGGPVSGGRTYLVGEQGPELFMPGMSGGITSNADLNRLADGEDGTGKLLAQALRYQTFELANAINGLGSRLARRYVVANSDAGGGYGSGTLSGAGGARIDDSADPDPKGPGYGRRALGRRIRGGSDGGGEVPSGPRVHLGKMSAAGRGRYAKFDSKSPAIMGGLMAKYGLTAEQAAGVMGNLGHESARFTAYHEGGKAADKGGVGWGQWTGPRRHSFERWTAAHGLNPTSDEASWRFLTEGDPETARAIAAVKKTNNAHDAVRAFHDAFERSADISHGRIVKKASWDDRLSLADRAKRLGSTPGTMDKPKVPDAIASRAKSDAVRSKSDAAAHAKASASGRGETHVHAGAIVVNAQPHHDEHAIADIVHRKFNDATRHQYSDGVYG